MPTVLPPAADIGDFVTRYGRTCRIRLRQNPVIHARVGTEDMDDEEIAANIRTVLNEIESRMDQGANNVNHVHVKTTMGPAIKIGA
jgi:large subunit ribosomal protein L1